MRDSKVLSVRTRASKTLRYRLAWLGVVGVVAASAGPVSAANAGAAVSFSRWQGHDRYGTAAALAEGAYPNGAADVIVASGVSYADALAAGYLSGYLHGPILLTDPRSLPGDTITALAALHARRVRIVGGPQAVDPGVAAAIAALPAAGGGKLQVTRIAGSSRYETAAAVAEVPAPSAVGVVGGQRTAIVASGANFPDALAGSPLAAGAALPILLTDPAALSGPTADALTRLGIKQVLVLGGSAAVSPAVDQTLAKMGITVHRLAGPDRGATAAAIANWAVTTLGFVPNRVAVARGDKTGGGVDALAVGPLAGTRHEPLLLTDSATEAGSATLGYLRTFGPQVSGGDVAGGPAAISPALKARLEALATGSSSSDPNPGTGPAKLHIAVANLPDRTAAAVTVTGPGGYRRTVTATTDLTGLDTGAYHIAADPVTGADGTRYIPTVTGADPTIGADTPASGTVDYYTQISAATKVLDPAQIASATVNSDGTTTVVTAPGAPALKAGDIIATGIGPATPDGLLVSVSNATAGGQGKTPTAAGAAAVGSQAQTLTTRPAYLQSAVPQGNLDFDAVLPPQSPTVQTSTTSTARAGSAAGSSWLKNISCAYNGQMVLQGALTASMAPALHAHWSRNSIGATATATATIDSAATATINAVNECTLPATPLAPERSLTPIVVQVGPVPVVVVPRLLFTIQADAQVDGAFNSAAAIHIQGVAGVSYEYGQAPEPIASCTRSTTYEPPTVTGNALVNSTLSSKLTLALYGIAGPVVNVDTSLHFGAQSAIRSWYLSGEIDAGAELNIPPLNIDISKQDLIRESFLIAHN
ncbi:cell wall-binding repeat-containing protein [Catenulispora subtropica]|uniref:Ig-like domain-containing protein n=1 Tax=Catenulispora subtropica TaxID=450798 RepID=A0ABP5BTA9_9ACTN